MTSVEVFLFEGKNFNYAEIIQKIFVLEEIFTAILERLTSPSELHRLSLKELQDLAEEIRKLILKTVSKNGGHLAPSLGTVELTLALYSVFDFAIDKIVWDVGHQAYAHKILTGRQKIFPTLRTRGGISGFPRRSESNFDYFGVGHASTSISAALGLLLAEEIQGKFGKVIAVIGDGALTGGEAFEALNHAGQLKKNLIVVLNDNEMSIAKNVGALSDYLSEVRLNPKYRKAKKDFEEFVKGLPMSEKILQAAYSVGYGVKSAIVPNSIFEALGFTYLGPIDGHNLEIMQDIFSRARELDEPVLIHVHTKKGKGYQPAEKFPEKFHGVGKFNLETGEVLKKNSTLPTYTEIFSDLICELAEQNKKIVAITAAMPAGTGLKNFSEKFPDRFFDVGIAEEHAVTLAAGMAAGGLRPIVAVYSTFIQRAYDQILHDVCLQKLPVIFCLDRAGLVGEDGATHHGVFDMAFLRTIPNINILVPKDGDELKKMLAAAVAENKPVAIRYPRGEINNLNLPNSTLTWGKAEVVYKVPRADVRIFAVGSMVETSIEVAKILTEQKIFAEVFNARFVKPFDRELIKIKAQDVKLFVTAEEGVLNGGFGSAVEEFLADENISVPILRFGIGDRFIEHASRTELLEICGLTARQMANKILDKLNGEDDVKIYKRGG